MALPKSLQGLLYADAYPHACKPIRLIETHISWVLLTGDVVYKLKKPVKFSFLDFSTLALREHFCREELRCNRAFAPSLYLDVVAVYVDADGSVAIGGEPDPGATVLEWAVQLLQFDPEAQLDRLIEHDALSNAMLADFGATLAAQHAALPRLHDAEHEIDERVFGPVRDNFAEVEPTGLDERYADLLEQTRTLTNTLEDRLKPLLIQRMREGFVRECHGDLHLSNLVLIENRVTAFDCLEFNANLRWIDTFSDVAFLFMDCHERDRADLAYAFLNVYMDASGDYAGAELLGYFAAYRSMVRAKVAALRWQQEADRETEARFLRHLEWAKTCLERPRGRLVLMCGLSGAGKSYLADRLAPLLPAIRLRSDVARKTLAGFAALAQTDSPVGGGIYSPDRTAEVFRYIQEIAAALLNDGENVIVDATFISKARRDTFLALAEKLDSKAWIVYCHAPESTLRQRIQARAATRNDASEATLDVLDAQLEQFDEPGDEEPLIRVPTDQPISDAELANLKLRLLA